MLLLVGAILAAAFYVSEWNDVTERLAWIKFGDSFIRPPWRRKLNAIAFTLIAMIGITRMVTVPIRPLDLLDWIILLMFSWGVLSILWATNRPLAALSIGCWLSTACATFGIGLTCSLEECVLVVAAGCAFYFIAGLVHEFCTFRLSFSAGYRFFGGVGCNRQGAAAVIAIYSVVFLEQMGTLDPLAAVVIVACSMGVAILSRSRTGTWAGIVGALAWAWVSLPSTGAMLAACGAGLIGFCLIVLISPVRRMVGSIVMLGRKAKELKTLSGRTIIWSVLWPVAMNHPVCGNGFRSIWTDEFHHQVKNMHPFFIRMSHAHNAYLDSLLNGGMVAVGLLVACLGTAVFNALHMGPPAGPFMIGLITYATVHGLCESTLTLPLHRTFTFFALLIAMQG